jgi:hypothetical protein
MGLQVRISTPLFTTMSHARFYLLRCCPACNSLDVRRSHRRGLFEVLILPLLLLRPFRCEDCTKRHYNLIFTRALHEPKEGAHGRV